MPYTYDLTTEEQSSRFVDLKYCPLCECYFKTTTDEEICDDCADDFDTCPCGDYKPKSEQYCEYCRELTNINQNPAK